MVAGTEGAAAAAIANAVKASGVIVQVKVEGFQALLQKAEKPLVVVSQGRIFKSTYKYLLAYGGFVFYTKTSGPLDLPRNAEVVMANSVWVPG